MRYRELFKQGYEAPLPQGLYAKIVGQVEARVRRAGRIRLAFISLGTIVSLAALVFSIRFVASELSRTGFYQYTSLLYSDGATVLTYWKEFSLSLFESIPLFGITLFLGSVCACMVTARLALRNIRGARFA